MEECGHTIEYITDIDDTIADVISRLEYDSKKDIKSIDIHQWICQVVTLLSHYIHKHDESNVQESFTGMHSSMCIEPTMLDISTNNFVNLLFVNTGEPEDEIYLAMVLKLQLNSAKIKILSANSRSLLKYILRIKYPSDL